MRLFRCFLVTVLLIGVSFPISSFAQSTPSAVLKAELIYPLEGRLTPQCHASTIVQATDGTLLAAWFGGTRERNPDVGIWVARQASDGSWGKPVEVANGVQPGGTRLPCWNPVLCQPRGAPLILFFKVGPSPSQWWGEMMISDDGGKTWRDRRKLPGGGLGPIKDKPEQLADGSILCPSSDETGSTWRVHFELTRDLGKTWQKIGPIEGCDEFPSIQPTILKLGGEKLQILCRTRGKGVISTSVSEDGGKSWSALRGTKLLNPNSGIDAVTLADGRHLLVYNPTKKGRTPLAVAVSKDGIKWRDVVTLETEPGEYSYPAMIQAADGKVHITYSWKRESVKHVVLDPEKLK